MKISKILKIVTLKYSKGFDSLPINYEKLGNKISNSLPENLHFILIGIMLGDGSIYRSSSTSNSRFEMSFGSKYKEFAESI